MTSTFLSCSLCPTGSESMDDSPAHNQVSLVFFSTFKPISLTPDRSMQRKGVPVLYERVANQEPSLYVCPVENVLGRVPLLPCYLKGNTVTVNTIPHSCRSQIPRGAAADSRPDSWTGSRLFEESRARGAATLQRRREAAASKMGVQEQST